MNPVRGTVHARIVNGPEDISVSRQLAKVLGVITGESSHMRSARAGDTG